MGKKDKKSNERKEVCESLLGSLSPSSAVENRNTNPVKYYIIHGDTSAATLKISIASSVYGINLVPKKSKANASHPFLIGPALLVDPDDVDNMVFGGNAICKFLSMVDNHSNQIKSNSDRVGINGDDKTNSGCATIGHPVVNETTKIGILYTPVVDNWLEWEREELRHALEGSSIGVKCDRSASHASASMNVLDETLSNGDGVYLIGGR